MKNINIFLSYCWDDSQTADDIYAYFKNKQSIELHRDVFDIKKWGSIKEYMHSINNMDYVIILISDAYLKSANCMYEVLEVMRDRHYEDKIFPAIINSLIYKPIYRAKYVKHWENEFNELEKELKEISVQNLGKLNEDLKRCQDISSNIAEFLDMVSDMNNPKISDVSVSIEDKLNEKGLINKNTNVLSEENDLFATLGIRKIKYVSEPTDLEINQFVKASFKQVILILSELCKQFEEENSNIQINIEKIDIRTTIFRFYRNGKILRSLKIFLRNMFDGRERIGIAADCSVFFASDNNSWNEMYIAKFLNGQLNLHSTMSFSNKEKSMNVKNVVVDIWEKYIQMYL